MEKIVIKISKDKTSIGFFTHLATFEFVVCSIWNEFLDFGNKQYQFYVLFLYFRRIVVEGTNP